MIRARLLAAVCAVSITLGFAAACGSFSASDPPATTDASAPADASTTDAGLTANAPMLAKVTPATANATGGATLTITGSNFVAGMTVTIAGASAAVTRSTSTTLTVTAPKSPGPIGFVPVTLNGPSGTVTNGKLFRYYTTSAKLAPAATLSTITDGTAGALVLATGDLRGKKRRDLVASVAGSSTTVTVLLANGDGTFQAAQGQGMGPAAHAFTTADFNGDGHADLAFVDGAQTAVSTMFGRGDGTFGAVASVRALPMNEPPVAIMAADVIGKNDLLITANAGVHCWASFGDGGFGRDDGSSLSSSTAFVAFDTADLDGDGLTDVVAIGQAPSPLLVVATGNDGAGGHGDGTFGHLSAYIPIFTPNGLAIADMDGDGHGDVATAEKAVNDGGAQVIVYHGTGAGGIVIPPSRIPSGWAGIPGALNVAFAAGDFNGDSTIDLAMASATGHVSLLLNDGLGTFTQGPIYALTTFFGGGATLPVPTSTLIADDFDGDGRTDLAVAGSGGAPAVIGVMLAK